MGGRVYCVMCVVLVVGGRAATAHGATAAALPLSKGLPLSRWLPIQDVPDVMRVQSSAVWAWHPGGVGWDAKCSDGLVYNSV